jgi:hypothetical protein
MFVGFERDKKTPAPFSRAGVVCDYSIKKVVGEEFHLLRSEVSLLVGDCGKEVRQFISIPDFFLNKLLQCHMDVLKSRDFLFSFVDVLCKFRSSFIEVA